MLKKEIRKNHLQKRISLVSERVEELSKKIVDNFSSLTLPPVHFLLSYYPLTTRNEFNVTPCEKHILLANPLAKMAWPKIAEDNISMQAFPVNSDGIFIKNVFGIMEPAGGKEIAPADMDMIFVPLIAFDPAGYRVGYGRGFYDRYLSRCRPDAIKIGFSFAEAVDSIDDINEFDVPLNLCVTPMRVYEF